MNNYVDIARYSDVLFSYYDKVVPLKSYEQNLRFRNRVLMNAPELHGPFKKLAALMVSEINVDEISEDNISVKKNLPDILRSAQFNAKQLEIFYNLLIYDYVVALVVPYTTYKFTCSICGTATHVKEDYDKDFILNPKSGDNVIAIAHCPHCNSQVEHSITEIRSSKSSVDFIKKPINIILLNPFDTLINKGIGGTHKIFFAPQNLFRHFYFGIRPGAPITSEQIINVPLNLIKSIINMKPLMLNSNTCQLFRHPIVTGLNRGFSPLMLSLKALLHTNILRKGREADALIKIDPQYIVTPAGGTNSAPATLGDGRNIVNYTMQSIKTIKEEDTNGLMFMPNPMQAVQLFPEPKRWINSTEILAEESAIINSTGFDISVLQNGVGAIAQDPFAMQVISEIVSFYTNFTEEFVNKIVKIVSLYDDSFSTKDYVKIKSVITKTGTIVSQEEQQMATSGMLPVMTIYRKHGYTDYKEVLTTIQNEQIQKRRSEIETQIKLKELEMSMAPMMMAKNTMDPQVMSQITSQLVAQAEQIASELSQMDEGTKKSQLDQIQKQDYALHAIVVSKLKDINTSQNQQAKEVVKNQQGGI